MTDHDPQPDGGSQRADSWRLAVVGGLLLAICAALAMLWIAERKQRIELQRELDQLRTQQLLARKIQSMLAAPQSSPAGAPQPESAPGSSAE